MKKYIALLVAIFLLSSCDQIKSVFNKKEDEKKDVVQPKAKTSKLKNGEKKYYFKTGELKSIVTYKNNKKTGVSHTFYKTGEKQYDIPYVDGMKHGTVKWYYKSGKVYRETEYQKGKKTGYQRKYWENGKLKSEILFKNNMPGVGLKEITKSGKEKSVSSIHVEKINKLKSQEEYIVKMKLSNGRKNVQFYMGELIEGKYFPKDGKGFMEIETKKGTGEIRIPVRKGAQLINDFAVVAVEKTAYKNKRILSKTISVSVRNPN